MKVIKQTILIIFITLRKYPDDNQHRLRYWLGAPDMGLYIYFSALFTYTYAFHEKSCVGARWNGNFWLEKGFQRQTNQSTWAVIHIGFPVNGNHVCAGPCRSVRVHVL